MAKNRIVRKQCLDGLSREGALNWRLKDGCLIIGGEGVMRDFTQEAPAPWMKNRERIRQLTVEAGVENIGGRAFSGCEALVSVTLGPDVRRIGWHAFRDCAALEQVTASRKLLHWRLPPEQEPVTLVGHRAFFGTPWQDRQEGGLIIRDNVVLDCIGTPECVAIPKGITGIGPMAFERLPLKSVSFPATLETVGACAFYGTQLRKVELSKKLRQVDAFAFGGNPGLEQVWLGNRKACVHPRAFAETPVEDLELCEYGPWLIAYKKDVKPEERFEELDPRKWTPAQLRRLMKDGTVLLRLRPWQDDQSFSITSLCYDYRQNMMWYAPSFCLCEDGICGDEQVMVASAAEWRSRYEAKDTWLSLADEGIDYVEREDEIDVLEGRLRAAKKHGGKLYFSWDRGNFYGPLELFLAEKWLDENPEYHVGLLKTA